MRNILYFEKVELIYIHPYIGLNSKHRPGLQKLTTNVITSLPIDKIMIYGLQREIP